MTCYREFGWSAGAIDEIMGRGWEAERLAVYFEEIGAYEHAQAKKYQNPSSSPADHEITELVLPDQEADVYIPDDDYEE